MMKKIVVIGGGYAGILTAKKLARKCKKNPDVEITLIDKNPFHTMLTELHEVAAGRVEEGSIQVLFAKVFAKRRVNFVQDMVRQVDFAAKTVRCEAGDYPYDYAVMAAGSQPSFFGVPGAAEYAHTLWSYQNAVDLREHIMGCFRAAQAEADPDKKRELLTFYVVGAGFTGVEMCGELAEFIPILCDGFGIPFELVTLVNVDMLKRVVPTLPEKLSCKIQRRLEKMGARVVLEASVTEIGENYIVYKKDGAQTRAQTNTVVWVAGIEGAGITQESALVLPVEGRGRLLTDKYLRSPEDDSLYVAGDNIFYIPEGSGAPVPQMVENCEQSADTVAHNIHCALTGEGAMEEYRPKFHGVMVSVGGRYGVARVGTAAHMMNLPSFLAMFVKHFINIVYFVQVLGWNKAFSYMKHEFFTIRHKRSFVGGHFSNRTPSFLLVPLRLWLGAVWVFEGVMKIVEGWFSSPKLEGFFGGASAWFNAILNPAAAGSGAADAVAGATGVASGPVSSLAADAVASATAAVSSPAASSVAAAAADAVASASGAAAGAAAQSAGEVLFNWNILGLFRMIFVCGKPLDKATLADYAFKLDIPLLNSFLNAVVLPSPGMQLFMQGFIVVAEILIGLSMMGGLLTTFSGVVSLVLLFMFASTTGLYLSSFWMAFGAIALLFGGGAIFGLDYYASPLLKKGWRKIGWVRKWYLYHD